MKVSDVLKKSSACNRRIKRLKNLSRLLPCCLYLLFSASAHAGSLNASVTPGDLSAGATTTYTVTFTPVDQLDNTAVISDVMALQTQAGGPNLENAVLDSISVSGGGSLTGAIVGATQSPTLVNINISGGMATSANTVTFVLSNVVNPGAGGQGPDYTVRTVDFAPFPPAPSIQEETVAGSIYTGNDTPAVSLPIDDQTLIEEDGPQVVVMDLNNHFSDGDGDPLTFTVDPGNDASIATASINGSELTVTPVGSGTTDITIRASDLPSGMGEGEVTDTFAVTVIGEFINPSVTPADFDTGAVNSYTISFSPDTTIDSNQFIILENTTDGPDYTNASLGSITGGTLSGSFNAGSDTTVSVAINSGTAGLGDTVTIVINNVINPASAGQGPDYTLRTFDLFTTSNVMLSTLPGNTFLSAGAPTITSPISDQTLDAFDGTPFVIADLGTVFTDGDGDPLTFTVEPGTDTSVATAAINGNELTVTPVGSGTTTVMVKASDLPSGTGEGEVIDSFDVRVIGVLGNPVVTPSDLTISTTTSYTVSFTPSADINNTHIIQLITSAGGPDFSAASLNSLSGGTLTGQLFSQGPTIYVLQITAGTANSADTVSFQLDGVMNPSSGGQAPDYELKLMTLAPFQDVDRVEFPGNSYTGGAPFITNPISDQLLSEAIGPIFVINDLNTVFSDGDGDALTFTVEPGVDTMVATASISNDELTVTPIGSGVTTVMIKASDLPSGSGEGEVIDSFQVRVIGELDNASVTPQSLDGTQSTDYVVSFDPASTISAGDFLTLNTTAGGPDFTSASLSTFSGGTLQLALSSQNATGVMLEVLSGTATTSDTVQYTLASVQNPAISGMGPDYTLELLRTPDVIDFAIVAGNMYTLPVGIFSDGFELIVLTPNELAKIYLSVIPFSYQHPDLYPSYDDTTEQYNFLSAVLTRDDQNDQPRTADEVLTWLETVLITSLPNDDWDGDGQSNRHDMNPFGIR